MGGLNESDLLTKFVRAASRNQVLGAHRHAGLPRIRLHDLRHTAAALALATGMHPKVMSDRLGHSSIAITLDVYGHLVPGLQEDAAEAVGALLDP